MNRIQQEKNGAHQTRDHLKDDALLRRLPKMFPETKSNISSRSSTPPSNSNKTFPYSNTMERTQTTYDSNPVTKPVFASFRDNFFAVRKPASMATANVEV